MPTAVSSPEAYALVHQGAAMFARMEERGIPIDLSYVDRAIAKVKDKAAEATADLEEGEIWQRWKARYGRNLNWGSKPQLADILYGEMGFRPPRATSTGRGAVDVDALQEIVDPWIDKYIWRARLLKLRSTWLAGIKYHTIPDKGDTGYGKLHPSMNLHIAKSFRSSMNDPSFQNVPIRDKRIGKIIRRCFVSTDPNYVLVEIDYRAIEVRVAACYHRDPVMLRYIEEDYDMHRDMGAECYMLPKEEVPDDVRQQAKGDFVFASFYGSYYPQTSYGLWKGCIRNKLKTKAGLPLHDHLRSMGIKGLGDCDPKKEAKPGTFEHHIKRVEKRFWDKRFPGYRDWKMEWYDLYAERGYFRTLTGFVVSGVYSKNQVINIPVQGAAFQCLLWACIEMDKEIQKQQLDASIIAQIHDSCLARVHVNDLPAYAKLAQEIMVDRLRDNWKWIITPLAISVEASPPGGAWSQKEKYKVAA